MEVQRSNGICTLYSTLMYTVHSIHMSGFCTVCRAQYSMVGPYKPDIHLYVRCTVCLCIHGLALICIQRFRLFQDSFHCPVSRNPRSATRKYSSKLVSCKYSVSCKCKLSQFIHYSTLSTVLLLLLLLIPLFLVPCFHVK